jgi:serine/threonine-protein kinase
MNIEGKAQEFPSQFGRYTLVERLATGGMAEVFKAKILSTHGFEKLLVIKRILPNLAANKTFVSMFIDEAKLTAQLIHPKIVQVTDFGEECGQFFIALEFVDGFDGLALLRHAAQKHVRLPIPICMFIAQEVLDALDYAHNAQDAEGNIMHLVHRDISPSNVFISHRGDVKLGDFGIAHAQERESKTQAGTLKGKYGYMSPEQVGGVPLDRRSDVFAVGIVLSELLMGKRLFSAENDLDVLLLVRDARLSRWEKHGKDMPQALDAIVRKALTKNPEDRFQSAAEFRDALIDLQFQFGIRIGPSDLGIFASDLFDPSPQSIERIKTRSKKWEIKVQPLPSTPPPNTPGIWNRPQNPADTEHPHPNAPSPHTDQSAHVIVSALGDAMSGSMSLVDIDQISSPPPPNPPSNWPLNPGAPTMLPRSMPPQPAAPFIESIADLSVDIPAPDPVPLVPPPVEGAVADNSGELSLISPMRVFADLAIASETGVVRLCRAGRIKDVYLVRGAPESVTSNLNGDRFGEYLVSRGFLRSADLERAMTELPRFGGKLGDALVNLGFMRPLDAFRLLSQHVRERVMELFTWTDGAFGFFRGLRNLSDAFQLGLNSFEILGAGVLSLSYEFLQTHFEPLQDFHPRSMPNPRLSPESFHLGPTPREVLSLLDGSQTLRNWTSRFRTSEEILTFYRTVYLLVESSLAQFE